MGLGDFISLHSIEISPFLKSRITTFLRITTQKRGSFGHHCLFERKFIDDNAIVKIAYFL